MSVQELELSQCKVSFKKLGKVNRTISSDKFKNIGVVPFFKINGNAYAFMPVDKEKNYMLPFNSKNYSSKTLSNLASEILSKKSAGVLNIPPQNFLENSYVLYAKKKKKFINKDEQRSIYDMCVIFIELDFEEEESSINLLNDICGNFRENFHNKYLRNKNTDETEMSHILWVNQLNFIYLAYNDYFSINTINDGGEVIPLKKSLLDEKIPLDYSLTETYFLDEGEIPINLANGSWPEEISYYPYMDDLFKDLILKAIHSGVDLFFNLDEKPNMDTIDEKIDECEGGICKLKVREEVVDVVEDDEEDIVF